MPAFQLIDDRFVGGAFGTSPFGTDPFGGPEWAPWTLPTLQVPSDDVTADNRHMPAEVVHRRRGAVVGVRKFHETRRWHVFWDVLGLDAVEALKPFHSARTFYLLQDEDETGRKVIVYWGGEFEPQRLRGQYWRFDFMLEEVIS